MIKEWEPTIKVRYNVRYRLGWSDYYNLTFTNQNDMALYVAELIQSTDKNIVHITVTAVGDDGRIIEKL